MVHSLRGKKERFHRDQDKNSLFRISLSRLFIIKDGRIVMKGDEGPFKYSIKEAENWIENNFDKNGNEPN